MEPDPVVCLVDDDPKILRLVSAILGECGIPVQTFSTAQEFVNGYRPGTRGCLLLDIQLPGLSGTELHERLSAYDIDLPVVFLTATADVPTTVTIMKRGALDVLQKPFDADALVAAVRNALARDAAAAAEAARRAEVRERAARLTPRERQVMDLVVRGLANKLVARELGLSDRTVEIHRGRVMEKMRAESIADLVRMSMLMAGDPVSSNPDA